MNKNFLPNSVEVNTQLLAMYLPSGKMYEAKNKPDTVFYKLLFAVSKEFTRVQEKIYEVTMEYDINTTKELISEWEKWLGIPDDCFTNTVSLEQRRKQCKAKLGQMNLQTEGDYIQLAANFGYDIEILHGVDYAIFPMKFPILLGSIKEAKFTMIVKFLNVNKPSNVFPITFPFVFQAPNIVECLFNHLKPTYVRIIYWYADYP